MQHPETLLMPHLTRSPMAGPVLLWICPLHSRVEYDDQPCLACTSDGPAETLLTLTTDLHGRVLLPLPGTHAWVSPCASASVVWPPVPGNSYRSLRWNSRTRGRERQREVCIEQRNRAPVVEATRSRKWGVYWGAPFLLLRPHTCHTVRGVHQ